MFEPETHEIDLSHQLVRQAEGKIGISQRGKWGESCHPRRADNGIHVSFLVIHLTYRKRVSEVNPVFPFAVGDTNHFVSRRKSRHHCAAQSSVRSDYGYSHRSPSSKNNVFESEQWIRVGLPGPKAAPLVNPPNLSPGAAVLFLDHPDDNGDMLVFRTIVVGIIFNVAVIGVLLFLPAGTLNWWRAWVLLAVFFIGTVIAVISLSLGNKGLLEERLKPPVQKGQPLADKIVVLLLLASFFGLMVFIPLDVFHFHLMGGPDNFVSWLGLVLFVVGWSVAFRALKENAFAAPVVKHQAERRHMVIDTGLYGIVRHPMYAGGILVIIGMPLWLESYAATVLASVPVAMVLLRIVFEEKFLRRELEGYDEYAAKVRCRLIPSVW